MSKKIKLLVCGDSPTEFTGFGDVVRNLLSHFPDEVEIHVWAINYTGEGYWDYPKWRLYPTGPRWLTEGLGRFLGLLNNGGFTHVWLFHDPNVFTHTDFPAKFRHVCATRKIRSLLYFPVDAALEREWTDIIRRVDVAATYTQYAYDQVRAAGCTTPLQIVPHGVSEFFQPVENRKAILEEIQINQGTPRARPFATEKDFLLFNVNKNEWRKDPYRSLEILAGLKEMKLPVKMIFRMAPRSLMAGIDLEKAGTSLGLELDKDWIHIPAVEPDTLRQLYNAADLYLTTTMGEGWGLGITEALACGCPVALPLHTSCYEIYRKLTGPTVAMDTKRFVLLREDEKVFGPIDTRVRRRVHLNHAVQEIADIVGRGAVAERPALPAAAADWLSWPRISKQIQQLLFGNSLT
jgi:glycosyltransferase involved in cell wall biosynthesis